MTDELSADVKEWLAIRKKEALKIDPETAEVDWCYAQLDDPMGFTPTFPKMALAARISHAALAAMCGCASTTFLRR
jgi:hypothetical protein